MAIRALANIKTDLSNLLPEIRNEFGVGNLWIVGSRARHEEREDSDLDVMVQFERRGISLLGFCRLERTLADKLGLKVILVEIGAIWPEVQSDITQDAIL